MMGFMAFQVGFVAAVLLITLWFIARHEADLDWPKLMMVTAATGALCIVPPLLIVPAIVERFHINAMIFWPLIVLGVLAWNIGTFVLMLNKFVWVPIPKALVAWLVLQVAVATKDGLFAMLKGEPLVDSMWTSVTGMQPPGHQPPPPKMDAEMQAALDDLKRMGQGGPVLVPDEAPPVSTQAAIVATQPAEKPVMAPPPPDSQTSMFATDPVPVVAAQPEPQPVASAPDPASDPGWKAAEKLLVFKGKSVRSGRVSVFVNNTELEVGGTAGVTYQGRHYTWTLIGIDGLVPKWQPKGQPVELPPRR